MYCVLSGVQLVAISNSPLDGTLDGNSSILLYKLNNVAKEQKIQQLIKSEKGVLLGEGEGIHLGNI